jgi:DNA-binding XRE family transcriptional regulator
MHVTDLDPVAIGARIREARVDAGIKPSALAREVEVEKETIYRLEAGKNVPSLQVLNKIAHVTRVHLEWLARGMGPKALQADDAA